MYLMAQQQQGSETVSDKQVFLWLARINLDCKDYYLKTCLLSIWSFSLCILQKKPGRELAFLGSGFPLEFLMGF